MINLLRPKDSQWNKARGRKYSLSEIKQYHELLCSAQILDNVHRLRRECIRMAEMASSSS